MGKKYRIDYERNIGTVLFIVEGGRPEGGTELRLLKAIFSDILGFEMQELRRHTDEFIGYRGSPKSKVIGLNIPQNQITEITGARIDALFARIRTEFGLKPENYPLFFLYDRDVKSYRLNELRRYLVKYSDPYASETGDQGQLLLSYPAVESYLISCQKDCSYLHFYELGKDVKPDAADWGCTVEAIQSACHITHAAQEMDDALATLGCDTYDLDNLKDTLLASYDAQQAVYQQQKQFSLLSLISMALLELGVLVEVEEEQSIAN